MEKGSQDKEDARKRKWIEGQRSRQKEKRVNEKPKCVEKKENKHSKMTDAERKMKIKNKM